jgi:hypothetical protein
MTLMMIKSRKLSRTSKSSSDFYLKIIKLVQFGSAKSFRRKYCTDQMEMLQLNDEKSGYGAM